ncbi:TIGR04282 family arsenosugar biosynthesis glycosyltransferase [Thermodesulfobacteriota bacterium]
MDSAPDKLLLVIVAKAPVPGEVKTRLFTDLTPEEATDLYRCFLQDKIAEIASLKGIDLAICYTPVDSKEYFTAFTPNGFHLFPQSGKNLGERLNNIFVDKLAEGYNAISIIDSDSPDLPKSIVQESFHLLTTGQADAVFGPCYDGGYYLVGMRKSHPELFRDIPWSTPAVLQRTLESAAASAVKTKLLPRWNDLDTFEDLLAYYRKHKDKPPECTWTGGKTFRHLSRMKRITWHA